MGQSSGVLGFRGLAVLAFFPVTGLVAEIETNDAEDRPEGYKNSQEDQDKDEMGFGSHAALSGFFLGNARKDTV